jgi:6-phosphogluconolactonase
MMRWMRRVAATATLAILPLTTGCAGFFVYPGSTSGGSGATGNYVYVVNGTTGTLAGFAVGTGTLTALSGSPYTLGFTPTAVAVNPANTIVFVSGYNNAGTGVIYAFSIGSAGALSALNNGSAVGSATNVAAMDISPDGQWLVALDSIATANIVTLDEFKINSSTGVLTGPTYTSYTVPGTPVVKPHALKFSPNGQLAFVALGTAGDLVYTFNTSSSSGALNPTQSVTFTSLSSDNGLAVSPNGSYLYIARSGVDGELAAYSIGTNGSLTSVSALPFAAGTQPYSVAVNQAGTNVYVANRAGGTIYGYSVASSTGALTALSSSPYTSGTSVTALAKDKSGKYLLAANNGGSPDLEMYSFDSSANLVSTVSISTGTDPTGPVALAATH